MYCKHRGLIFALSHGEIHIKGIVKIFVLLDKRLHLRARDKKE